MSAADLFVREFGTDPAGVWRAPGRVNLIGEHTDYSGGLVLPLAIDRAAHVALALRHDGRVRVASGREGVWEGSVADVGPGSPPGWPAYLAGAAWALADRGHAVLGLDAAVDSDVPVGAGLSSSAALMCATLLALDDLLGLGLTREELAALGQRAENVVAGVPCGVLDHSASLRCTAGHALFLDTRTLVGEQVPLDLPGLALLVTDTRAPHALVDGQYAAIRAAIEAAQSTLGQPLRDITPDRLAGLAAGLDEVSMRCARHVVTENARVLRVCEALLVGRPADIGDDLVASHASLRDDLRVTCRELDLAVEAALAAGALGARMTGGGFGGCTISLVPAHAARAVAGAVADAFAAAGLGPPTSFRTTAAAGAARDA